MDNYDQLARTFKALSDSTRLSVLAEVRDREVECTCNEACCPEVATVSEIASKADVTLPTISYHLKELVAAGLVTTRRNGRRVFCRIDDEGMNRAAGFLADLSETTRAAHEGRPAKSKGRP